MIIIHLRFDGGSAEEEHDIAHIASSIVARLMAGFFLCASEAAEETRIERAARLKTRSGEENQHGTARVAGHFSVKKSVRESLIYPARFKTGWCSGFFNVLYAFQRDLPSGISSNRNSAELIRGSIKK